MILSEGTTRQQWDQTSGYQAYEPVEVVSSSLGLQTPLLSSVEFEMQASLLKHSSVADGSHARKHERESAASQA